MTDDGVGAEIEGGDAGVVGGVAAQPPPPSPGAIPQTPDLTRDPPTLLPKRRESPDARWPELVGVIIAGFFGNLVLRSAPVSSLAGALVVLTLVIVLVGSGRVRRRDAAVFLFLAAGLAPWLMVRADSALTAANVVAIVTLLGVGTGLARTGSAFDTHVREMARNVLAPAYEWLYGVTMIKRLAAVLASDKSFAPVLRGLLLAAPVLAVFGTLLASADDVFAKFLLLGNLPTLVGHLIVTLLVALGLFGWVSLAAHRSRPLGNPTSLRILGPFEVAMVLGGLVVLFSAFVATQVLVALGGADHVLQTEGLTQADHARAGFFQLLWVAGLATSLVGVLRAVRIVDGDRGRDRFRGLGLLTLALTLVIAGVSVQRLVLYVDSFGLTPLRFWALAGALGVSLLIVVYAASVAGWRPERSWFPSAAIIASAAFVFGLNMANPDNLVAEFNIDHQASELDVLALATLSDDAVVTMVDGLASLDSRSSDRLVAALCTRPDRSSDFGVFDHNSARVAADDALDRLCADRPTSVRR